MCTYTLGVTLFIADTIHDLEKQTAQAEIARLEYEKKLEELEAKTTWEFMSSGYEPAVCVEDKMCWVKK